MEGRANRHNLFRYWEKEKERKYLRMTRVLDSLDCISCVNETLESGFVYNLRHVTEHGEVLSRCKTSQERKSGGGRATTDKIERVRRMEIFKTSAAIFW